MFTIVCPFGTEYKESIELSVTAGHSFHQIFDP